MALIPPGTKVLVSNQDDTVPSLYLSSTIERSMDDDQVILAFDGFLQAGAVDELNRLLTDHNLSIVSDPFKHFPRLAASKAHVEQLDRTKVDVVNVLRISEQLELDEVESLHLWEHAIANVNNKEDPQQVFSLALNRFFIKRDLKLSLLYNLFRFRNSEPSESCSERLILFVQNLTDKMLVEDNFASKLLGRLQEHNTRIAALMSPQNRGLQSLNIQLCFLRQERRKLAECLFVLYFWTHGTNDEIKGLLTLIRDMSNRLVTPQEDKEATSLFEAMYLLIIALASVLDLTAELYDRQTQTQCVLERRDRHAIELLLRELGLNMSSDGKPERTSVDDHLDWKHDGIRGLCYMIWGTFLGDLSEASFPDFRLASKESRNRVLNMAFDGRGILFLRGIIRSKEFVTDNLRLELLGVLDILISKVLFIRSQTEVNENMDSHSSVEEILVRRQENFETTEVVQDSLDDLIMLLSSMNILDPEQSFKFFDEAALGGFLHEICDGCVMSSEPQSLYVTVLGFIASLCTLEASSFETIQFLSRHEVFNWSNFAQAIKHYQEHLSAHVTIPIKDQFVLCIWLRICANCVRSERCFKQLLGINDILDGCLNLLRKNIDSQLSFKSHLVNVVSKCARFCPQLKIWQCLTISETASTNNNQVAHTGFVYWLNEIAKMELDQRESFLHSYPVSRSMLDLIWSLMHRKSLEDHKRVAFLGSEINPGMLPYFDFVLTDVFLKLDQRTYSKSGEKWKLASSCLQIFVEILDGYTNTQDNDCFMNDFKEHKEDSYSSAFWIMTKLLEGGSFFQKLIELIESAGFSRLTNSPNDPQQQLWFLVASHGPNLDVRNSSLFKGDYSNSASDQGYGMFKVLHNNRVTNQQMYDGGRLSSWLMHPVVSGWTDTSIYPVPQVRTGFSQDSSMESKCYNWDDGDAGGLWREHAVKLAIKLLERASQIENWFLHEIQTSDPMLENRLERLHRLFSHKQERLTMLGELTGYPFSAEIRSLTIGLLFRLSSRSSTNSIVHALETKLTPKLSLNLMNGLLGRIPDACMEIRNMDAEFHNPVEYNMELEHEAFVHMRSKILELVISDLQHPPLNLSQLVLGLQGCVSLTDTNCIDLNSKSGHPLCLLLDILDDFEHPWHRDPGVIELLYRLIFKLCDDPRTGRAMSVSLNTQCRSFWLRHFQKLVTQRVNETLSFAWVLKGLTLVLRISQYESTASQQPILMNLFSVDDKHHLLRILEALHCISMTDAAMDIRAAPKDVLEILKRPEIWELHDNNFSVVRQAAILNGNEQFKQWAIEWNTSQRMFGARVRMISAWKDLVEFAMVDCRQDLLRCCGDDNSLLLQLVQALLHSIGNGGAPLMMNTVGTCLVTLVHQLRYGDYAAKSESFIDAIAAATGSFTMSLATGSENLGGLSRISREDHRVVLETMMEVFKQISRSSTSDLRCSMYTAFLTIVQGTRESFANYLSGMSVSTQLPGWMSEISFLGSTREMNGSNGMTTRGDTKETRLHDLRTRASNTLDILQAAERGNSLLDLVMRDLLDSDNGPTRLLALCVLKALIESDVDNSWLSQLLLNGTIRLLITIVVDRFVSDRLVAESREDKIFEAALAVLSAAASTRIGAIAMIENGFLTRFLDRPLAILCDKRALELAHGSDDTQERRHDLLLPFLRLILLIFSVIKKETRDAADFRRFQVDVLQFLRVQKRLLSSALGFLPVSVSDIKESILLLGLLSNCCSSETFSAEMGPAVVTEIDAVVYDLVQELQNSNKWAERIVPSNSMDSHRSSQMVSPPPAELNSTMPSVSLFALDVYSQQRRLLQHAVTYCRVRSRYDTAVSDESINAVITCLDASSKILAAVARASGERFVHALASDLVKSSASVEWNNQAAYLQWTCATLLQVLEGALAILYMKLSDSNKEDLRKWLSNKKLLANYFAPVKEKSALEQLEDVVKSSPQSKQFLHLILRRLRELVPKK